MKKVSLRDIVPHSIAIASGLALWIIIPIITGNREAWGSSIYYYAGLPLITLECLVLGYFFPYRSWRWVLDVYLSQAFIITVQGPTSNLLPPALVFLAFLSIPFLGGSYAGAFLRSRYGKRHV
jgi:hypothetical protein